MKTALRTLALTITVLVSCAKAQAPDPKPHPEIKEGYVRMDFCASLVYSYAFLAEELDGRLSVGDSIAVFDGISPEPNKFVVWEINGLSAGLTGTVSEKSTSFEFVYPYSAARSFEDGVLKVNVPEEQRVSMKQKIDPAAVVFVGHAREGEALEMYNVVAPVKFTLSEEGLQYIEFSGNGPELIAGDGSVATLTETITPQGASAIVIRPSDGAFEPGVYYAATYPSALYSGYSLRGRTETADAVLKSEIAVSYNRSLLLDLGDLDKKLDKLGNPAMSKNDLLSFARCAGYYGPGDEYRIGADIDMEGEEWPNPNFYGILDGQNHRIYNFVAKNNTSLENVGFIATLGNGTDQATVKNLCVGSKDYDFSTGTGTYDGVSKITFSCLSGGGTSYKYPGLVSYAHNNTVLENVVNFIDIDVTSKCTCRHRTGGVAGTMKKNVTMKNCANFGTVQDASVLDGTETPLTVGGVCSCFDGEGCKIENCVNYGNVTVTSPHVVYVGGVLATVNYDGRISGCINKGKVEYYGAPYTTLSIAGVLGRNTKATSVTGCRNEGLVSYKAKGEQKSGVYAGGICGQSYNIETSYIDCDNSGDVVFDPNGEKIQSSTEMGGILAYDNTASTIRDCDNSGNITIKTGVSAGLIEMGGIIGRNVSAAITIDNCHNTGDVSNSLSTTKTSSNYECIAVGGIVGRSHQPSTIKDCSCKADLANYGSSPGSQVGGMAGYSNHILVVNNFSYKGKITADEVSGGTGSYYSGFVGQRRSKGLQVSGCSVDAEIDIKKAVKNATYVGGLYGFYHNTGDTITMQKTDVKAVVTGAESSNAGILVGAVDSATSAVLTIGTAQTDPVRFSGSLNGVSASKDNLVGKNSASSSKLVIND